MDLHADMVSAIYDGIRLAAVVGIGLSLWAGIIWLAIKFCAHGADCDTGQHRSNQLPDRLSAADAERLNEGLPAIHFQRNA